MSRFALLVMSLALLPLAGCISAENEPLGDAGTDSLADENLPALPEPIEESEMVIAGADPANFVMGVPCVNAAACYRYPFTLESKAKVDAVLEWGLPVSDFDLYVFSGGEPVDFSAEAPPTTSERVFKAMKAGEYEIVVVAWVVAQDTFTLKATFEHA